MGKLETLISKRKQLDEEITTLQEELSREQVLKRLKQQARAVYRKTGDTYSQDDVIVCALDAIARQNLSPALVNMMLHAKGNPANITPLYYQVNWMNLPEHDLLKICRTLRVRKDDIEDVERTIELAKSKLSNICEKNKAKVLVHQEANEILKQKSRGGQDDLGY